GGGGGSFGHGVEREQGGVAGGHRADAGGDGRVGDGGAGQAEWGGGVDRGGGEVPGDERRGWDARAHDAGDGGHPDVSGSAGRAPREGWAARERWVVQPE